MDSEGVKKYFKDLLECPVCFLTIDSAPVFQCHNGHVVCKDCHPKLGTCPICRDANLYDTPMAIRNLKLEEIIKRLQSPNSETVSNMASESIQIDAIVSKKPNQVAVCSNTNDIVEDHGENMTSGCSMKDRCYWFCCVLLPLGIILIDFLILLIYVFAL